MKWLQQQLRRLRQRPQTPPLSSDRNRYGYPVPPRSYGV